MTTELSKNLLHSIPKKLYAITLKNSLLNKEDEIEIEQIEQVLSTNEYWCLERDSGWVTFTVSEPPYHEKGPVTVKLEWKGELVHNKDTQTLEFVIHEISSSSPLLYDAVNNLQFFIDCENIVYAMFM